MLKAYKSEILDDTQAIEENPDITEEFLASCSATIVDFLRGLVLRSARVSTDGLYRGGKVPYAPT